MLLGEIEFIDVDAELPAYTKGVSEYDSTHMSSLRLLAARLEQNTLQVAYICGAGVTITKLFVKDKPVDFDCRF